MNNHEYPTPTFPLESSIIMVKGGRLEAEDGSQSLAIHDELKIVGRARDSALRVNHETVSLVHAELQATPKGVRLKDRRSRNGTFVSHRGDETQIEEVYLVRPCGVRFAAKRFRFVPELPESVVVCTETRFRGLLGTTPEMQDLFSRIERHAWGSLSIFIGGETGTGKERVARAIHEASSRSRKPFVAINCAAVSPNCLESELFGHVRGAFTGADRNHPGVFVEADGGTLFFDEVAEMSRDMQVKLLRVLQEHEVRPVGGTPRKVDVRTLFATHVDLAAAVNQRLFRHDLYHRITQARMEIPPLRRRLDDLPLLLEDILRDLKRPDVTFDEAAMELLRARSWPGNVRELHSVVACALDGFSGSRLTPQELGASLPFAQPLSRETGEYDAAKDEFDRQYYEAKYLEHHGNVLQIARAAGKDRATVRAALRRFVFLEPPAAPQAPPLLNHRPPGRWFLPTRFVRKGARASP